MTQPSLNQQRAIRQHIKQQRRQMSARARQAAAKRAKLHLIRLRQLLPAHANIAFYEDSFGELPTYPILQFCQRLHHTAFLPVVRAQHLRFAPIYPKALAQSSAMFLNLAQKKHPLGMNEPISRALYDIHQMDACFCPLVAVSRQGVRMGMGGGFYDRTLQNFTGLKIGWCYDFQLIDTLIQNPWDVPMDIIMTPSQLIYTTSL